MQCPACQRPLRRLKAGSVTLDACHGGCGGIWFDHRELDKVNREHPEPDAKIAEVARDPGLQVAENPHRHCPRCKTITLEQKLYSLGSGVILDRCPECQGIWLDHGELEKIREALHPRPRHRRVVPREAISRPAPVDAALLQQIQILHRGPQPHA